MFLIEEDEVRTLIILLKMEKYFGKPHIRSVRFLPNRTSVIEEPKPNWGLLVGSVVPNRNVGSARIGINGRKWDTVLILSVICCFKWDQSHHLYFSQSNCHFFGEKSYDLEFPTEEMYNNILVVSILPIFSLKLFVEVHYREILWEGDIITNLQLRGASPFRTLEINAFVPNLIYVDGLVTTKTELGRWCEYME